MRAVRLVLGALLGLLGVVCLVAGGVAGMANRELVDANRFVAHVDAARTDPDVVRTLARLVTDRLVASVPDLVAVRPLIEETATTTITSDAAGTVLRATLLPVHEAALDGRPVATVDISDLTATVVGALGTRVPAALGLTVPSEVDVPVASVLGPVASERLPLLRHARWLAWLGPPLGVLALAGAGVVLGAGRRARRVARTVARTVGAGLALAGLTLAAGLLLAGAYVRSTDTETLAGAAAHAVWADVSRAVWTGPVVALAVGLVLLALARPRATLPRWRGAVGALTALALVAVVLVGAWPDAGRRGGPAYAGDPAACNGHRELCDRPYDQVSFPATHNSMAAANEPGWFLPEQPDGIIDQLDHGVRALLIDSWYAERTERPGVVAQPAGSRGKARAEAVSSFGTAAVQQVLRAQRSLGLTPRGQARPYLCHGNCELGSTRWLPLMKQVRRWLAAHPREVVTFFVQDEVSPADTAALFRSAGLLPYVYTPTQRPDEHWPTLGQMIDSGKRLVVLMENHGGGAAHPWLLDGFDWAQDTPFLFRDRAALEEPTSCAVNRGDPTSAVFLLNHWISDPRRVSAASVANQRDVLLTRARRCAEERGRVPTYVAVDFYDQGSLLAVVDVLNGFG